MISVIKFVQVFFSALGLFGLIGAAWATYGSVAAGGLVVAMCFTAIVICITL